jgi:hypothetical protein
VRHTDFHHKLLRVLAIAIKLSLNLPILPNTRQTLVTSSKIARVLVFEVEDYEGFLVFTGEPDPKTLKTLIKLKENCYGFRVHWRAKP